MLTIELGLGVSNERATGETRREWNMGREALTHFMAQHGFDGHFILRPVKKTRWRGDAGDCPFKLSTMSPEHRKIMLVLRHPEIRGNAAWECALVTPAGINTELIYSRLEDVLARKRKGIPIPSMPPSAVANGHSPLDQLLQPVAATPPALPAKLVEPAPPPKAQDEIPSAGRLLRQIQHLETAAGRERARRQRVTEIAVQRATLTQKIAELHGQLEHCDRLELELLDESEKDKEAQQAIEALKGLNALVPN